MGAKNRAQATRSSAAKLSGGAADGALLSSNSFHCPLENSALSEAEVRGVVLEDLDELVVPTQLLLRRTTALP